MTYLWRQQCQFLHNFAVFCYDKCKKHSDSWLLPRVWVMRGSTNLQCWNLQSLMCNWSCVVELLCHNRRVSFLVQGLFKMTDFHALLFRPSWYFTSSYALWRQTTWLSLKTTSSLLINYLTWRHIFFTNIGIALKLCRLVVAIICRNIFELL